MPTRPHWAAYAAEFLGTGLLVFLGVSIVIYDFGPGSPMANALPSAFALRLVTGFLFGGVGALLALSPLGRISGAHLDPALSWAFWAVGSLSALDASLYTVAQLTGASLAALLLPAAWGAFGRTVAFGATLPAAGTGLALLGEVFATAALVGGILWFVGHPRLRRYTPALIPPLVALLVAFEAPWSGTSMNPARSLGPALISGSLGVFWIYLAGPALGAGLAAVAVARRDRVHVAKIAHHGHDPFWRFHGPTGASVAARVQSLMSRGRAGSSR